MMDDKTDAQTIEELKPATEKAPPINEKPVPATAWGDLAGYPEWSAPNRS